MNKVLSKLAITSLAVAALLAITTLHAQTTTSSFDTAQEEMFTVTSVPAENGSACKSNDNPVFDTTGLGNNSNKDTMSNQLAGDPAAGGPVSIKIGSRTFTATLLNNATVTAFKARLPMTVAMSELNGNEKLYNFPTGLPTNASNPGTIQTGDLMLYGSTTLVLFYKSFPTPYSYTRLGRIDNPSELAAARGCWKRNGYV